MRGKALEKVVSVSLEPFSRGRCTFRNYLSSGGSVPKPNVVVFRALTLLSNSRSTLGGLYVLHVLTNILSSTYSSY